MSSLLAEIGLSEQLILSYIIGIAGAPAVYPYVRSLENIAWSSHSVMPPDAKTLAAGVAQGQVSPSQAAAWAAETGFGTDQFNALIDIANVGPGTAYAFELWRRGVIDEAGFRRAIKRLGLEQEWIDDLVAVKQAILTPEQLAVMIQRTVVANPGILPNQPSTSGSNVPPMPQVNIDPLVEAAGMGISEERLAAMARIIGLPASPDLAARMHFRGIITEGAYNQAILEGNTRGEWAPFLLDGFRQIPTAEQFVEAHLRGWITPAEMYAGTALHGMTQADTDLEFQVHRRPLTPHQIKQAIARGASFNPAAGEIQNPYSAAAHQSSLGPEWYELYAALAPSYPSLFITNRLVSGGTITATTGADWLRKAGNADEVVTAMEQSWSGGTTTAADPHVAKAQTQLWTTTHKSYIAGEINDTTATTALTAAGVATAAVPQILTLWAHEFSLTRKELTATQVRKALNLGIVNPATGVAWTQQDAITRLLELGYNNADASVFLQE